MYIYILYYAYVCTCTLCHQQPPSSESSLSHLLLVFLLQFAAKEQQFVPHGLLVTPSTKTAKTVAKKSWILKSASPIYICQK